MIKKLLLLSAIASSTACTGYNQYKSCDPEKNYLESNPQAIEELKILQNNGEVKSKYIVITPTKFCNDDSCGGFNSKKYDYIEMYFNDEKRVGIYTITKTDKLTEKCLEQNPSNYKENNKYCYVAEKNINDKIKSRYKYTLNVTNDENIYTLEDLQKKIILFKLSYQVYSTGAIGGPGGGTCPKGRVQNPSYNFNPYEL